MECAVVSCMSQYCDCLLVIETQCLFCLLSVEHASKSMKKFIEGFVSELRSMDDEEFQSHVRKLCSLWPYIGCFIAPPSSPLALPIVFTLLLVQVEALVEAKLEDDNSLDDEVQRNWDEVLSQRYQFDRIEKEVCILTACAYEAFCMSCTHEVCQVFF